MRASIYIWHRRLSLIAGVFTLLWVLSGLLHPFMSAWGPHPVAFKPPDRIIREAPSDKGFTAMLKELNGQEIFQLRLVKIERDWAWQVTKRNWFEYYDPDFGAGRPEFENIYAENLARYYSGSDTPIKKISLQDHFDLNYPEINRLLPVYKVEFDAPHDLRVYVDPSSDRLGSITDTVKSSALKLFQFVHTLSFLDQAEAVRVLLVLFSVLSVLAISGLGIALRFSMKPRLHGQKPRILHGFAAYILWLPVLMMTTSGIFHLVVRTPLVSDPPLPQQTMFIIDTKIHLPDFKGKFSDLRLLSQNGKLIWVIKAEDKTKYVDARTKENLSLSEEDWARGFVKADGAAQKIPMYTDEYGFAFKRLPVWRFEKDNQITFVDPAEGLIAATVSKPEVVETWVFTRLHKWQFLDPLTGKQGRDLIVVSIGVLIALMAITGLILRLKRRP